MPYNIQDLGTLGTPVVGAQTVKPEDINDGRTVVGQAVTDLGTFAFSVTMPAGPMFNLETWINTLGSPDPAGSNNSATGINVAGQIAFMAQQPATNPANPQVCYAPAILGAPPPIPPQPAVLTLFPQLPGFDYHTGANPQATYNTYKINEHGQIVGATLVVQPNRFAFFSKGPRLFFIPWKKHHLPGVAYGINDGGEIVGCIDMAGGTHAFRFPVRRAVQDLNIIRGQPFALQVAYDINASGDIVGQGAGGAFLQGPGAAVRAVPLGTLVPLAKGGTSAALGINNNGQIVGYATVASGTDHACIFKGGAKDLNALIPPGSGWILKRATAINNLGHIVGYGQFQGSQHGFLLT